MEVFIGGVELDATEGSAVVELETGELTAVLHVVVVGPSVDVKGDDFHKPKQHDSTLDKAARPFFTGQGFPF